MGDFYSFNSRLVHGHRANNRQFRCVPFYLLLSAENDLRAHKVHAPHTLREPNRPRQKQQQTIYEKYCLFSETIYNLFLFLWKLVAVMDSGSFHELFVRSPRGESSRWTDAEYTRSDERNGECRQTMERHQNQSKVRCYLSTADCMHPDTLASTTTRRSAHKFYFN